MKKRKVSFLVIICIFLFTLMGCSEQKNSQEGVNKRLKGKINIVVDKQRLNYIKTYADEFNKVFPNVKISLKETNSIYEDLENSHKNSVDIVVAKNEYTQQFLSTFTNDFLDISDSVEAYKNNFSKGQLGSVSFNNKMYGVPLDRSPYIMLYRKDIFDKNNVNIDDIRTWEDYIGACNTINGKLKSSYKFLWQEDKTYLYKVLLSQLGETYVDKKGNLSLNPSNSKKVSDMMKKIRDSKIIAQQSSYITMLGELKKGKLLATICSVNDINLIMSKLPEMKNKLSVKKVPSMEIGGNRDVSMNGYNMLFLKNSKNEEAVSLFLEFTLKNEKLQTEAFLTQGIFPANVNAYKSEQFNKNVEYFNDKIWLMASNIQTHSLEIKYPTDFNNIEKLLQKSFP